VILVEDSIHTRTNIDEILESVVSLRDESAIVDASTNALPEAPPVRQDTPHVANLTDPGASHRDIASELARCIETEHGASVTQH
jgi:hypothetical protein